MIPMNAGYLSAWGAGFITGTLLSAAMTLAAYLLLEWKGRKK